MVKSMEKLVLFHPHALSRMKERGAEENEIRITLNTGELFPAKFNRKGRRKNFPFHGSWHGKYYANKQIEVLYVESKTEKMVIIVITKYF